MPRPRFSRALLPWACLGTLLAGCSSPAPPASASPAAQRSAPATAAAPRAPFSALPPLPLPPTARTDAALAYDGVNHRMLLFGGRDRSGPLGDTYEWNGTQWAELRVSGPGPHALAAMAWDPVAQEVVLVGQTSSAAADTWTWDGAGWSAASADHQPDLAPSPRLCWDDATSQLVLVGVTSRAGTWQTWTWSGGDWSLAPGGTTPNARDGACAFDFATHRLFFTSAALAASPGGTPLLGVQAWNGGQWGPVPVAAPGPGPTVLVPDYAEHAVVAVTATHATAMWLGGGFEARHAAADVAVHDGAAYGYYPPLSLVVAMGGRDAAGSPVADVSAWDGRNWNAVP